MAADQKMEEAWKFPDGSRENLVRGNDFRSCRNLGAPVTQPARPRPFVGQDGKRRWQLRSKGLICGVPKKKSTSGATPNSRRSVGEPEVFAQVLRDDGVIPNNQLPLLIYFKAVSLQPGAEAESVERVIVSHGWGGMWRNGIFTFHHYHSTAHEVLVVFRGHAEVRLGGDAGVTQKIKAGDVVIIPAGVAHKNLSASDDFGIVGAYPRGQSWDLCYGKRAERPRADRHIAEVPLPATDPIFGASGPLLRYWPR